MATCPVENESGCADTPYQAAASPFTDMEVCPVILQENGYPIEQEQTAAQSAAGRRAGYIVLE